MPNFTYQPYKGNKTEVIRNIKDIERVYGNKEYQKHKEGCTCEKCRKTD